MTTRNETNTPLPAAPIAAWGVSLLAGLALAALLGGWLEPSGAPAPGGSPEAAAAQAEQAASAGLAAGWVP